MATVASIVTNLKANTGQFNKALGDAEVRTRQFSSATARAQGQANNLTQHLKRSLGEESAIGQFGKMMRGSGAIAGLSAVSGAVLNTAKHAAELRQQFLQGELTLEKYKSRMVELIPILGQFAQAGREIGETIREAMKSVSEANIDKTVKELGSVGGPTRNAAAKVFEDNRAANLADMAGPARQRLIETERHQKNLEAIRAERGRYQQIDADAFVNVQRTLEEHGGQSSQFDNALAAAKQARAARLAFESTANRLMETEAETHKKNMANIQAAENTEKWRARIQAAVNTVSHAYENLESRLKSFNDAKKAAEERSEQFVTGAMGAYERLKAQQNEPPQFAGALQVGTQEEYAARQQRLFAGQIERKSDKELAKEAVDLHKRELDQLKEIKRAIEEAYRDIKIADIR